MRVLMLTDAAFATREHRMITRLEVALADEGVRVARASPEGRGPEHAASLAVTAEYEPDAPFVTTGARAARLLQRLGDASPDWTRAAIDLVHVWGEGAWNLGAAVAKRAGAALVVEMWSHRMLIKGRRFERRAIPQGQLVWIAPGDHTAEAIRQTGLRGRCRVAPWGAHAHDKPSAFSDPVRPVSAAVLATGRDPGGVSAALEGLALASRRHEDLLVFLDDAAVANDHEVWRRLRELRVLDRVSLLPNLETSREAVLHADLFVRPEASSEHRSVVIDAMASGLCVITRDDPVVEALQRDQTCLFCPEPTALGWENAVLAALDEPQRARSLGLAAQNWVRTRQSVSAQAAALLDAYEGVVAAASGKGAATA
jgi:glycosyltransferase involved in cell wall biosynthesis